MAIKRLKVNWWFAGLVGLAVIAILFRLVFVDVYEIPRVLRHHAADFGFVSVFTTIVSGLLAVLTPKTLRDNTKALRWLIAVHLGVAVFGTLFGLNIEREDYYGIDQESDGFDPGMVLGRLSGADTDTFDWWDIVVIALGGGVALYLQWQSTRLIRRWRRVPLLLA